ncbi:BgTH12-07698 [Blumeria graminis f. sp. triticale]|uniref:BgTH12-07698 n=1 Tax=Blumeria graminis f. sp. triticale TaxID=1689686 RepID=A0A9W4D7R9_BLUGR|nr:BgTH12-07698 [Blumeria graminis f. sp. triticale]
MKFPSATSTLVFSGLYLSASASPMKSYFLCSEGRKISLPPIDSHENSEIYSDAQHGDPLGPNGEQCPAYRYTVTGIDGSTIMTLIQLTSVGPFNQVFERIGGSWQ